MFPPLDTHQLIRRESFPTLPYTYNAGSLVAQNNALAGYNYNNLLRAYLPGLPSFDFTARHAIARLLAENEDLRDTFPATDYLTSDHLEQAFDWLFHLLQTNHRRGHHEAHISHQITQLLEAQLDEDERDLARRRRSSDDPEHARALRLFLALAAISRQTRSHHLGRVLSDFFERRGAVVLERDSPETLWWWACGVYRAFIAEDARTALLEAVVLRRPEVLEVSRSVGRSSWSAAALAEVLRRLWDDAGFVRRRSRSRSRSRRPRRRREYEEDCWRLDDRPRWAWRSPSPLPLAHRDRDEIILRPRSAPGDRRRIERQADKVITMAEEMRREAGRLRSMASLDGVRAGKFVAALSGCS